MTQVVYLKVTDENAWQALAATAWGTAEDGSPDIPAIVSVDGPFQVIDVPAVFDDDGLEVTPAVNADGLAINLAAPSDFSWPGAISGAAIQVGTPVREFAT